MTTARRMIYVDSNVWLYSFTADKKYGEACRSILEQVELSQVDGAISVQVLAEVSAVLFRQYRMKDTTRHLSGILSYRLKIEPVTSEIVRRAADYSKEFGIPPYDGIHVATALRLGIGEIVSADGELDRVKRLVRRTDPLDFQ